MSIVLIKKVCGDVILCVFLFIKEIWFYSYDLFICGGLLWDWMILLFLDRFDDKNVIKWNLWKGCIVFNKRRSINDLYMIVVFFILSEKKILKIFLYIVYIFDVYG